LSQLPLVTARCFALIPAAGIGSRTGTAIPKQYLPVAGEPMIVHVLAAFAALAVVERIFVVVAPEDRGFDALALAPALRRRISVLRVGGASRDASVANGLDAMGDRVGDDDWVLVHDGARCGITPALIALLIERVRHADTGGLLAVPLDDTVKRETIEPVDGHPAVAATVDRRGLWRAQTPQMFRRGILADALATAREHAITITDEASAIEGSGHAVLLVPGSPRNFKVTTADDLAMMDLLLRRDGAAVVPTVP
jgi:2-C-methyl-D-erythritol 4-phosphate cytidylyltransferase